MNRIVKAFIKAGKTAEKKRWPKVYAAIDLHETVLLPTWQKEISTEYYSFAKEVLKILSERKDICLILWSCSLPEINKEYFEFFKKDGINFDYINENPEVNSTEYADFDTKLYFSVGLDDKFGFDPKEDWVALYDYYTNMLPLIETFENLGFLLQPDFTYTMNSTSGNLISLKFKDNYLNCWETRYAYQEEMLLFSIKYENLRIETLLMLLVEFNVIEKLVKN